MLCVQGFDSFLTRGAMVPVAKRLSNPCLCTAEELVDLIVGKYGKKYDLTIARRSFAGKDFVSLNVMWCGCC